MRALFLVIFLTCFLWFPNQNQALNFQYPQRRFSPVYIPDSFSSDAIMQPTKIERILSMIYQRQLYLLHLLKRRTIRYEKPENLQYIEE